MNVNASSLNVDPYTSLNVDASTSLNVDASTSLNVDASTSLNMNVSSLNVNNNHIREECLAASMMEAESTLQQHNDSEIVVSSTPSSFNVNDSETNFYSILSWQGVFSRVQATLRGSLGEIGWLKKESNAKPVMEKTERFLALLNRTINGVHSLPDSFVYLLVPGLFSNLGGHYFLETRKHFSTIGLTCHVAKIHSEASVETNALELKNYVEELYWGTKKKVVLIGHSKGGVDSAAAMTLYEEALKDKIVGLVVVQCPYGGSPFASDILRKGQFAETQSRMVMEILMNRILKGDLRSLEDLTYDKRREFLANHPLPDGIPMTCFHSEASKSPADLSTLSLIGHLPFPNQMASWGFVDALTSKLPVIIPLSAVLGLLALLLEFRYGEKSDGLVAREDAEVPGSVVVRFEKNLDHGWLVLPPVKKDPKVADPGQLCETLVALMIEHYGLT